MVRDHEDRSSPHLGGRDHGGKKQKKKAGREKGAWIVVRVFLDSFDRVGNPEGEGITKRAGDHREAMSSLALSSSSLTPVEGNRAKGKEGKALEKREKKKRHREDLCRCRPGCVLARPPLVVTQVREKKKTQPARKKEKGDANDQPPLTAHFHSANVAVGHRNGEKGKKKCQCWEREKKSRAAQTGRRDRPRWL